MHDFHCCNADEMHSEILAERVRELKETPKGVENMCVEMDKLYNEGIEVGQKRAEKKGQERLLIMKKEIVQSLDEMNIPVDKIAQAVKEDTNLVEEWLAKSAS